MRRERLIPLPDGGQSHSAIREAWANAEVLHNRSRLCENWDQGPAVASRINQPLSYLAGKDPDACARINR